MKLGDVVPAAILVLMIGAQPLSAAGATAVSVSNLVIDGAVSFPAVSPPGSGPGFVPIPYSISALPGESFLEVGLSLPPGGPPGPPLLAAVSASTEVSVIGNDVVQSSRFKIDCTFAAGCGWTAMGFSSRGAVTLDPGMEIKAVQFAFSDLQYVGGTDPLPVTLRADLALITPGPAPDIVLSRTQAAELTPTFVDHILLAFIADNPDFATTEFLASLNFETSDGGDTIVSGGTLASDNTFELRIITGPVPEPHTYAMFLAGLVLCSIAVRARKRQ